MTRLAIPPLVNALSISFLPSRRIRRRWILLTKITNPFPRHMEEDLPIQATFSTAICTHKSEAFWPRSSFPITPPEVLKPLSALSTTSSAGEKAWVSQEPSSTARSRTRVHDARGATWGNRLGAKALTTCVVRFSPAWPSSKLISS